MKILVTGCAGFIGSHLCEALLLENYSVVGIDNFCDFYDPELKRQNIQSIQKAARNYDGNFTLVEGDILDEKVLDKIFQDHPVRMVIHLAAMAGVRPSLMNPVLYEKVNSVGTITLLESMRRANVKTILFGSSSSVYGVNSKIPFQEDDPINKPISPYAQTKRAGELACHVYSHTYGFYVACLRFFTVYGPRQRPDLAIRKFSELMLNEKPIPIFGNGSFRRDFTYVDDIIDGILKCEKWITTKKEPLFEIFNLGESQTTSVLELIHLLEETLRVKAIRDFQPAQLGDVPITYADTFRAKSILGYHPKTPVAQGIKKFAEWMLKK